MVREFEQKLIQAINEHSIVDVIQDTVELRSGMHFYDYDLIVAETGRLIIHPGAMLYFGKQAGILSYGSLVAVGTKSCPISFKAKGDSWRNIALIGAQNSASKLEHCVIEDGSGRAFIPRGKGSEEKRRQRTYGGGLQIEDVDFSLSNCTIENNSAERFGGGIYVRNCNLHMENNRIYNNKSNEGGGLYVHGVSGDLLSNRFEENKALVAGAGIYITDCFGELTFVSNVIESNEVMFVPGEKHWKYGGGVKIRNSGTNHPILFRNNSICMNSAYDKGGAMHITGSSVRLRRNTIRANESRTEVLYYAKS